MSPVCVVHIVPSAHHALQLTKFPEHTIPIDRYYGYVDTRQVAECPQLQLMARKQTPKKFNIYIVWRARALTRTVNHISVFLPVFTALPGAVVVVAVVVALV